MKCVCIQYLFAIENLIKKGYKPNRNVILTFVPDEEIGGMDGMMELIIQNKKLFDDIDIVLDEGLANESNNYSIFYGERTPFWFTVKTSGNVGHGS